MNAVAKLTWTETKLQFRDWGTVVFGLLFPAGLLVALAYLFPGFQDPDPELGGARGIDVFTPIVLVFVLVIIGVSAISSVLATYRHDGILRRLRTTPVGPLRLVAAQFGAQLCISVLGVALAVIVALTVLDVPTPANPFAAGAALVLTAGAMFAIGAAVGALAPSTTAAQAIATILWIPLMALAGLWLPRDLMPETMRRISDLTPGGAGVDAVQQAWFGTGMPVSNLAVLAACLVVVGAVAAMTFRWD